MNPESSSSNADEKFSVVKFLITIIASFAFVMLLFWCSTRWIARDIWMTQYDDEWWKYGIVFAISQFVNCFAEWGFHRYMLHAPLVPGFELLFKQHHDIHHRLTNVQAFPKDKPTEWKNDYPIVEERQYKASYFPWHTYVRFVLAVSLIIGLVQWLFSTWPIVLVTLVSIAWSLCVYEILHAIEHWSADRWKKIIKVTGVIGKEVYSFHLIHHAHIKCNEGISGFVCGIPLADFIFGTYKRSKSLFWNKSSVDAIDLIVPEPRFAVIRLLDSMADKAIARYRKARVS